MRSAAALCACCVCLCALVPSSSHHAARYEREGRARRTVRAQKLWFAILEAQTETGTPYMLYKDACNRKSNQQNLGTIKSSNLCTEIVEYTSTEEVCCCACVRLVARKAVSPRVPPL